MNDFMKLQSTKGFEVYSIWLAFYLSQTSDYDPIEYNFKTRSTFESFKQKDSYKNSIKLGMALNANAIDPKKYCYWLYTTNKNTIMSKIKILSTVQYCKIYLKKIANPKEEFAAQIKKAKELTGMELRDTINTVPVPMIWYKDEHITLECCGYLLRILMVDLSKHDFYAKEFRHITKYFKLFEHIFGKIQ